MSQYSQNKKKILESHPGQISDAKKHMVSKKNKKHNKIAL